MNIKDFVNTVAYVKYKKILFAVVVGENINTPLLTKGSYLLALKALLLIRFKVKYFFMNLF